MTYIQWLWREQWTQDGVVVSDPINHQVFTQWHVSIWKSLPGCLGIQITLESISSLIMCLHFWRFMSILFFFIQFSIQAMLLRMSTMKPKLFGIQIWWYQTFLSQFCWASQQGRELATSGSNRKKIQFCQSYSYVNRKVWYHQIWIPNNLGFIVSDLTYICRYIFFLSLCLFLSVCVHAGKGIQLEPT